MSKVQNNYLKLFCSITVCVAGLYDDGTGCQPCEKGTYNEYLNQTSCTQCGTNKTTNRTGATSRGQCGKLHSRLMICPQHCCRGLDYTVIWLLTSAQIIFSQALINSMCSICIIWGLVLESQFYHWAKMSPQRHTIPTKVESCIIRFRLIKIHACLLLFSECESGTYINGGNCQDCEVGTYNDQLGQTSCRNCTENKSTKQAGANSTVLCGKQPMNRGR